MIEITGLDHLVLRVADLQRSIDFYTQVLGCTLERRIDTPIVLVQLRAGNALLDLVPADSPVTDNNVDHFCLRIRDYDEDKLRAYLKSHGVEAGESGTRYGAQGFGPSLYLTDPDGNGVELKAEQE